MRKFNNIKITSRLIMTFSAIVLTVIILAIISINTMNSMSNSYDDVINLNNEQVDLMVKVKVNYSDMRMEVRNAGYIIGETENIEALNNTLKSKYNALIEAFTEYRGLRSEIGASDSELDKLESMSDDFVVYYGLVKEIAVKAHDSVEAVDKQLAEASANPIVSALEVELQELFNSTFIAAVDNGHLISKGVEKTISSIVIIISIIIILNLITMFVLTKSISKPLAKLVEYAGEVAEGNIDINVQSNSKDELGILTNKVGQMVDSIRRLIIDIKEVAAEQTAGNFEKVMETEKYKGGFKSLAEEINGMLLGNTSDTMDIINIVSEYSKGKFDAVVRKFPGKKIIVNEILDVFLENITGISNEIQMFAKSAADGDLNKSIDTEKYEHDWNVIANSLNELLIAISTPVKETSDVLSEISHGNLKVSMIGNYKGEFALMKNAVNQTINDFNNYINDITRILTSLSKDNYDVDVTMNYPGDFSAIKEGFKIIIERINYVMIDINASADQVAMGARQISESSMSLSQGSTEQASAVEELNATIESIAEKTRNNAEIAQKADELSGSAKKNAEFGNKDMKSMLVAMADIQEASHNISKIIKVIDEIAFQTNLLALNAAVEAARAGQHGKGFTVVAEQVRTLASRSQDAAKDTTALIESTVIKVGEGMKIAGETAGALEQIVVDISDISNIASEISESSTSQAQSIEQINIGISQISQVTQSNTATSEEEAAFAEELSSQAEIFRNMVSKFNLKKL